MARPPENLPEGTDSIILGASAEGEPGDGFALGHGKVPDPAPAPAAPAIGATAGSIKDEASAAVAEKTAGIREQTADKVRAYAVQGKDKATEAIDQVVKFVEDAASTVDDKVGPQYGDYIRRASGTLQGLSTQLRDKDVDDLVVDTREFVRSSPAVAISAAAAAGFLLARLVKVGSATLSETAQSGDATT